MTNDKEDFTGGKGTSSQNNLSVDKLQMEEDKNESRLLVEMSNDHVCGSTADKYHELQASSQGNGSEKVTTDNHYEI